MRIWFNHWFSTAYHLINMMKAACPDELTFIGSSYNMYAIYRQACDEFFAEPEKIGEAEYVNFCLDFCKAHQIDLFVPRRNLTALTRARDRFSAAGVRLFADGSQEMLEILDDKKATYDFFRPLIPEYVPQIRIVHSLAEFDAAYNELKDQCTRVCYKLTVDEGARSFRVIDDRIESLRGVMEKPGTKITLEAARTVLAQYDFSIPMMLMPYLSGVEVSVDCVQTKKGPMIIPRYKTSKRYSEIIFDEEMMALCEKIMGILNIKTPMNIQFKMERDQFFLLEINPRMSGGMQLSCLAAGLNLPGAAIREWLGGEMDWHYPERKKRKVAHIETPICLD